MKPMISLLAATSVALLTSASSAQAQEVKLGVSMVNVCTVDLAPKWAVLMANASMTDQGVK